MNKAANDSLTLTLAKPGPIGGNFAPGVDCGIVEPLQQYRLFSGAVKQEKKCLAPSVGVADDEAGRAAGGSYWIAVSQVDVAVESGGVGVFSLPLGELGYAQTHRIHRCPLRSLCECRVG